MNLLFCRFHMVTLLIVLRSYNNSVVESFHASFKKEEVYKRTYKDYHEANLVQFSYIEGFYNSRRIISTDGYLTPDEKEELVS